MCSANAAEKTSEIFGDEALYVPYTDPGYILFIAVQKEIKKYKAKFNKEPQIVLLQNHGIFVAADSIEEIKSIYADVKAKIIAAFDAFPEEMELPVSEKMIEVLPAIRMLLSDGKLKVSTAFNSSWAAGFITDKNSFANGIEKPFNPDQMVYCMSEYLFIENSASVETIIEEAKTKIADFTTRKGAVPKVLFIQNEGVIVAEDSPVSVGYLKDMVNDFCQISKMSENFGGPNTLTHEQAAFIENWEVENYR